VGPALAKRLGSWLVPALHSGLFNAVAWRQSQEHMKKIGGELVAHALEDEGVRYAFGIPGTHNIELYDALGATGAVTPVLVTDEQSASFMADGLWRASGELGCVNVVPGAGLTHAMSGIAEAYMDNVPMLVLGCGIRRDMNKAFQLHDVDQQALVGPITKARYLVFDGASLYPTVREACRVARAGAPGPVFVEVPANLYLLKQEVPEDYRRSGEPGESRSSASRDEIDRAVDLLMAADRPLLYLGLGAAASGDALVTLAELLEAPVSTTFQGKGVFPESHPLFLWPGWGHSAPPFARAVARRSDLTLAIGCKFGEVATGSYGMDPPGTLIHVDIDPDVPGRNHSADLSIVSDAASFVAGILERLGGSSAPEPELRSKIAEGHRAIRAAQKRETGEGGVTPGRLFEQLQESMGSDTVFTTDSGNGTFLAMECLRLDRPGHFLAPVDYSCMGYAVPAAIGAKLGRPEAPVVALAGDGAFLMTGLELLTAAREELGVMVFVLRDRELAQIAQFQATAFGRKVASELPDYGLDGLARSVGVPFLRLPDDRSIQPVVEEAAAIGRSGRPVLVDVAIDYSRKTWFTRGVVKANLSRLPLKEQLRFVGRALQRKITR
jgi:acetolactate synthase-1/2/3 large subunit